MERRQYLKMMVLGSMLLWGTETLQGQYSGGSGTPADPYLIATPGDLKTIGDDSVHWDKHFQLTADLDMTGVVMTPIGHYYTAPFSGAFDGDGHTIANLTINLPDSSQVQVGLFGYVDSAFESTIFNLGLIDPDITGRSSVGALAGSLTSGTVWACYAQGGSVNGWRSHVGGLVGVTYADPMMNAC